MSRRRQKKANQRAASFPATIINGWSFHQLPPEPYTPPAPPPAREPYIEDAGNGWWTVHGGEHGPYDRHGRANAAACLAEIVARRKTNEP